MASTIKSSYGSNNQAITLTIDGLANNGARESTAVDNTTNLFLDALVQLVVDSPDSGCAATGVVNVYAYGTVDGGTTYTDGATGSDAGITLTSPPNARLIGVLNVVANTVLYKGGPWSVAAAFGGVLPAKWGVIIENKTGASLGTTDGAIAIYQGIYAQTV